MRKLIVTFAAAAIMAGASVHSLAAAQGAERAAGAEVSGQTSEAQPAARRGGAYLLLRTGDTVKVAIYELVDADEGQPETEGGGAPGGDSLSPSSFFQRVDLSGEYAIQEDGAVAIPRLGTVAASGRPIHDVSEDIRAAFSKAMGRPADVNLTITKRQPVYVVGAVKNSGAYEYVTGMMVIQAISLAGGIDRGASRSAQIIEHVRGAEKLDQTRERLKRLVVKKARLEADRDGAESVAVSSRLEELAGRPVAERLAATEGAMLADLRRAREAQRQDLDAQIASTAEQLSLLRQRASQFDAQLQARTSRLDQLQALQQRGGVLQTSLVLAQSDLADIEGRKQDFNITLAQTEQRLNAERGSRAKLDIDDRIALARDLSDVTAEIAEAERSLSADAAAAQTLTSIAMQEGAVDAAADPIVDIIRRTEASRTTFPADDMTELEPGDVIKVSFKPASSPPTGALRTP